MKVKIKKLSNNAIIPNYSKPGDAGLDITATEIISNTTFEVTYGTDISIKIPENHVGLLFPRSSIKKYEIQLSNSVGVIDSGYVGELLFTFIKTKGLNSLKYKVGDRIGQLIILPYPQIEFEEVEDLGETERGENGFGSTGR